MSDSSNSKIAAPLCPICAGGTVLKQVHREPVRRLYVFKCLDCAVEYPVVDAAVVQD